jgi:hypothetical protein
MMELPKPVVLVGLIRLREHCTFTWEEPARGGRRVAMITSTHCSECIAELGKLGYLLAHEDAKAGGGSQG